MSINEFLRKTVKTTTLPNGSTYQHVRPRVECADGYSVSVQAGYGIYSQPRIDGAEHYDCVELGYPSKRDPLINKYAEDPTDYTETVYAYVPVAVVDELIAKHGGIINKFDDKED